ncbi:mRNA cleavage and polyadenylation factor II complex, subunit CFT2 (CPSF subunit) [Trachipleistophora hominis]|uniref:Cleavage and polyadenylation specificity factor subunit 2 n=1 Tax=Trachipleistophora hominis TaxID=72359 RepID=L7JWR8_TRAHO|nr:mRNA cleavage and polyadenylation factor II complex, subunit CFT2 (CPSF subunit) [Trachipleistophora hominis]
MKIMLEWAGDIALKKFTNTKINPFAFKNLKFRELYSDIDKKTDIFVILDENMSSPFTNRIVQDLNDEGNVLVVFNEEHEHTIRKLDYIDTPDFKVVKENDNKIDKSQGAQHKKNEPDPENTEEEKMHRVVCKKGHGDGAPTFPLKDKPRPRDRYGEFFDKKLFLIKAEEKRKEVVVEKPSIKKTQEMITVNKVPFSCRIRTKYFNFNGLSDGNSVKTILESLEIEKLILLGKNKSFINFFYFLCHYNQNFREIYVLDEQILNLSTDVTTTKVNLEENFLQKADLREINGKQMASFKGRIKDNVLYYRESLKESLCLGTVKMTELRKQLLDNNLRVKKADEYTLVIEDQVKVQFNDGAVKMVGEMNGVYLYVRRIIYKNLYFIN